MSSTSDPFELDPVEADEAEVALPRLEVAEALRLAERYASYVVKSRRKALVTPRGRGAPRIFAGFLAPALLAYDKLPFPGLRFLEA